MKTTYEMLKSVVELKESDKDETWFEVDESTSIFVEILNGNSLEIAIEWRDIDTNETYEAAICDYNDNADIEKALDYIRRCALDNIANKQNEMISS